MTDMTGYFGCQQSRASHQISRVTPIMVLWWSTSALLVQSVGKCPLDLRNHTKYREIAYFENRIIWSLLKAK